MNRQVHRPCFRSHRRPCPVRGLLGRLSRQLDDGSKTANLDSHVAFLIVRTCCQLACIRDMHAKWLVVIHHGSGADERQIDAVEAPRIGIPAVVLASGILLQERTSSGSLMERLPSALARSSLEIGSSFGGSRSTGTLGSNFGAILAIQNSWRNFLVLASEDV